MGPLTDFVMGALNEKYNTNCPECRDQYGHFCSNLSTENDGLQCVSVQESCDLVLDNAQQTCPQTCLECPSWVEPADPSLIWYLLMTASITTPLSVWFFLPFLRGKSNRDERCYGLFSLTKKRLFGICGAEDDQDIHHRRVEGHQIYGHVESESFAIESGKDGNRARGEGLELT